MRLNSGARNPYTALQHSSKMLAYFMYAPLFDKHCALSTNPSLALFDMSDGKMS